jgi:serine/threonine protein phosphatase 1
MLAEIFMTQARTIAVGDIHGCLAALETLLGALELAADDVVVLLGDAVDRGPDSRGVLEQLLTLGKTCRLVPILGNHEQMLLDAVDGRIPLQDWLMYGGAETLDSYGRGAPLNALVDEHVEFIRTWGDYYETASHFFAHGNYLTDTPLADQPWEWLRWESLRTLLPAKHCSGKTAVLGHTSNKQGEIVNLGYLMCIDTYCYGGYWLTALEPNTGRVWQSNQQGNLREGDLSPPRKS